MRRAQSRSCRRRAGAHRHAERVLVRRRDVHRARRGTAGGRGLDVEPLRVDPDGDDACRGPRQHLLHARVAGLLDADGAAGVEQDPRRDLERVLRPAHHHDLVGLAADRARRAQVGRERLAQRTVPHRVAVVRAGCAGDCGCGARPATTRRRTGSVRSRPRSCGRRPCLRATAPPRRAGARPAPSRRRAAPGRTFATPGDAAAGSSSGSACATNVPEPTVLSM